MALDEDELRVRRCALEMAAAHNRGSPEDIIKDAGKYLRFLQGRQETPQPLPMPKMPPDIVGFQGCDRNPSFYATWRSVKDGLDLVGYKAVPK